jgi:hypothetical protein
MCSSQKFINDTNAHVIRVGPSGTGRSQGVEDGTQTIADQAQTVFFPESFVFSLNVFMHEHPRLVCLRRMRIIR